MTWSRLLLTALAVLGLAWLMPALAGAVQPGASETPTVLTARVDGPITPVVADYLTDGVREAERGGHQAFLVELDTPGGLDTSMREIIQSFSVPTFRWSCTSPRPAPAPPQPGR